jgi:hypothetical protein
MPASVLRAACLVALAAAASAQAPGFVVVRYELVLRVEPETRLVHGEASVTIAARDAAIDQASFSLNDLLTVSTVKRDGVVTACERGERVGEGRSLRVALAPALLPGASSTLTCSYEGTGLDPDAQGADWMGILLVRADEVRMSHQAQWYPIVPRDADARSKLAAPTRLELDLPAGFESLGPGEGAKPRKHKGREIHLWTSARPVQPSILAGKFKAQVAKRGKASIRVLSFPEHAAGAKAWGEDAAQSLETLGGLFGKVEVASYGIGEMRVRNGSRSYNYEADGFSVYDGVLFDRAPDAKKIAHEVAHLWFGGAADATGPGERFLSEGLAEHAAWLCVETRAGAEAAVEVARKGSERYFGSPGEEAALAETDFRSPRYVQVAYAKGAFALRTLRAWLGHDAFLAGLRRYLSEAEKRGGSATLDDFLAALRLEPSGAAVVDVWAEDWLRRPGVPAYAVELDGGGKGRLVQTGTLYRNPVELELTLAGGKRHLLTVTPAGLSEPWSVDPSSKVESVRIDPWVRVLFVRER